MLEDKLAALLFFEPSTRTRMSFCDGPWRGSAEGGSASIRSRGKFLIVQGRDTGRHIRVLSGYAERHRAPATKGSGRHGWQWSSPRCRSFNGLATAQGSTRADAARPLHDSGQSMPGFMGSMSWAARGLPLREDRALAGTRPSLYGVTLHTIAPGGLEIAGEHHPRTQGARHGGWSSITCRMSDCPGFSTSSYVTRIQRERFPDSACTTTSRPVTGSRRPSCRPSKEHLNDPSIRSRAPGRSTRRWTARPYAR